MKTTRPLQTARIALRVAIVLVCALPTLLHAQQTCPRFAAGSTVVQPENLFSKNGVLQVNFTYRTFVDANGLTRFCYINQDGRQSPTLNVNPGDRIVMNLKNEVPDTGAATAMHSMNMTAPTADLVCGATTMTAASVNVHFHGTNSPPTCHQDEVIHTLINSGETFTYNLQIPANEPPGLYWYHPHVHGMADRAMLGGASGAIIVGGIQNLNSAVTGLPQQVLVIRDNFIPAAHSATDAAPTLDLSLNYVPVPYPNFPPAVIPMTVGKKQFWRVVNASADSIVDLQVQYDGQVQTLGVVALDGVPTGSQDGTTKGKTINKTDIFLPPGGRAEFIVKAPSGTVKQATLYTLPVDTGTNGFSEPQRPLGTIRVSQGASVPSQRVPAISARPGEQRFAGLAKTPSVAERKLYFSEDSHGFYITVEGQTPEVFDPNNPPAITTTRGVVEDWTIENRALDVHEFHIHQLHFLVMERNGIPTSVADRQMLDTIQVPYWTGTGPYPSVKLRMDFRGPDVGQFVYHCHLMSHEDFGMMAIIQVNSAAQSKAIPAGMHPVDDDRALVSEDRGIRHKVLPHRLP
jgi:FtsP/CotA-like multicopper oxidase with cupredoxin domain